MAKWPEEVPVLTARDIHKGGFDGPRGSHCLVGWLDEVFPCWGEQQMRPYRAIRKQLPKLRGGSHMLPSVWNDSPNVTKTEIARVWNTAMAQLGYTEGNPEA